MKSLSEYFKSMYFWAVLLLLLCAAVSSYAIHTFPANLLAAIAACALLDAAVKKLFLKREIKLSASAVISGIIIGSIAPLNAPVAAILAAAAVAIASKYVLRIKGRHIFNPATLGLLVSLSLFRLGDMWWAASGFNFAGFAVPVTLLLIIANYKAEKLKISLPFLAVIAAFYAATQFFKNPITAVGLLNFFTSLPFYFAFIMLSEPKTSPNAPKEQIIFGIAAAVLVFLLESKHTKYAFLVGLLAANLAYSTYRNYAAQKGAVAVAAAKNN